MLAQVTFAVAHWSCVCSLLMMFTEAIDCVMAYTSCVWSSVAPLAIALYFAYLLYTVAVPPAEAAPVEKSTKTAVVLDDVSTDAGESDSEGSSRSDEVSDESPSVRAGADDDSSSVSDACLDVVRDGPVYSRDLLLACRVAPPPAPPGLEKPRGMYFTQPRPVEESSAESREEFLSSISKSRAGAWGENHWSGYHAKQARVKGIDKTTTPKTSPMTSPTAVRPTPPWLKRATVPQTFVA